MLTLLCSQGGCLPHVFPEHLMSLEDYLRWLKFGRPGGYEEETLIDTSTVLSTPIRDNHVSPDRMIIGKGSTQVKIPPMPQATREQFEKLSTFAWTDLFLQLIKVRPCHSII